MKKTHFLTLLNNKKITDFTIFSGLISVTEAGLESEGLQFHETHHDAVKMARAAASTYRVSGFGSAVVPLDEIAKAIEGVVGSGAEVIFTRLPSLESR